jgi:hypothetical protein
MTTETSPPRNANACEAAAADMVARLADVTDALATALFGHDRTLEVEISEPAALVCSDTDAVLALRATVSVSHRLTRQFKDRALVYRRAYRATVQIPLTGPPPPDLRPWLYATLYRLVVPPPLGRATEDTDDSVDGHLWTRDGCLGLVRCHRQLKPAVAAIDAFRFRHWGYNWHTAAAAVWSLQGKIPLELIINIVRLYEAATSGGDDDYSSYLLTGVVHGFG